MKKHLFLKSLLIAIGLLVTSINTAWGQSGFWTDGAWNFEYNNGSSNIWQASAINLKDNDRTVNLGVLTTFSLRGCWVKTYSNNNYYTQDMRWYYGIGDHSHDYFKDDGWAHYDPRTWSFCNDDHNFITYDVIAEAPNNPGDNTLWMYWYLDHQYHSGQEVKSLTCYVNFTIPGFTTTSTSQTFSNTTVGGESATIKISFGTHFGTALTTGNCSSLTDFTVTAIDETGVTVKFTPKTAGSKSETLTITDAHSKTCTISLTGKTKYSVTYNKGDNGSGDNKTADKVYGTGLTLRGSGDFTYTGYHQTAWNTNADGISGTSYDLNQVYLTEADLTLYPTWTANSYTIAFNANDANYIGTATGSTASVNATYDEDCTLTTNGFSRAGYTFAGWNSQADGEGTDYTDGQDDVRNLTSTNGGSVTLYAQWDAKTYTITLDNQYSVDQGSPGTHRDDVDATHYVVTFGTNWFDYYMQDAPSHWGYTFCGYYSGSAGGGAGDQIITDDGLLVDGSSAYTNASGEWTYPDNVTVYAKWTVNQTLSKNTTDLSSSNGAITLTYKSSTVSGYTASERTGYTLDGYFTAASDGDMVIDNEGKIYDDDDVAGYVDDGKWIYEGVSAPYIYAQWTPITYTISFAKNDDASFLNEDVGDDPDDITATYDVSYTMPANPYTRTGYTFNGWATEAHKAKGSVAGTDYDYAAGSSYSKLSSTQGATVTLFPKWTGNLYTVTFNPRGASVYPTSENIQFGETYGSAFGSGKLPEPYSIPAGKVFIGWYTSPIGGTRVTKDTQLTTAGAHTLYARYSDIAMVYFKNAIGWKEVYVTYDPYWVDAGSSGTGAGNDGKIYHKMSKVAGTDDIYYDQIPASCLSTWKYFIAFNDRQLGEVGESSNYYHFDKGQASFREDFDSIASMFVPKNDSTRNTDGNYDKNSVNYISTGYSGTSGDPKYTSGYWRTYDNVYSGYTLKYANHGVNSWSSDKKLIAATSSDSVFSYTLTLEANSEYDYAIYKQYKFNGKSDQWRTGSSEITSAACTDLKLVCEPENGWMKTTVAGEYTFKLTMKKDGHMYLSIEYPLAANDYRVLYSYDNGSAKEYASETIKPNPGTIDTISVFVHRLQTPVVSRSMKIQKCTGITDGVASWTDVTGGGIDLTSITANGVYNFAITQPETGDPTGAYVEKYEGDYYIRTQCADGGWTQYMNCDDNIMTHSAYSMTQTLSDPYSHYYCRFVSSTTTDIKFAVATKYSPNISGTMVGDGTIGDENTNTLPATANVRFSWNEETNALKRAYIKDAQGENARFMVMHGKTSDMIFNPDSSAISASGSLAANELQFDDMGDWIYQVMLTAKPGAQVSIIANYNNSDRYLVGDGNAESENWETIIGGDGSKKYTIMAIYDFKTNRLMNAWTPDGTITEALTNIDMLWIRHEQNAAQQITFSGSGALTNVKAVGAIELRYNELVGRVASWTYETRPLLRYFIAFPFDVNVSDIFGLHGAELGRDFVIRKYDGAERAKNSLYYGDGDTYWVDLTMDSVMHANEGYSLVFDNEYLNGDLGSIWENKTGGSSVYLYFPAADKIASISDDNKGTELTEYLCQNTRTYTYKGSTISHGNSDSHWHLIGSPLFVNSYVYDSKGTNGQSSLAYRNTLDSYYAYNAELNSWIPTLYYNEGTSTYYACKAMHAMLVQFAGTVEWSKTAPDAPAGMPARQKEETPVTNKLITLNLLQDGEEGDHTYIKMDENGNSDFMLCEDLFKIDNTKIPNIFSYASGNAVAYNKVAIESQTINLGVDIRKNGTYTFEMPENVVGQVILVDHYAQTRTNLNLENYEVNLNRGNYYDRFSIEININNAPTAIDGAEEGMGSLKDGKAHKFIENGVMYILKNGEIFDAQGNRVR